MVDAHIFSSFRYLQTQFIYYVSAVLSELEHWPCGGECSPYDGPEVISFKLVKSLCGTYMSRKLYGRPSLSPSSISLRASGHEFVNVVKCGKLKRGRCSECSTGTQKKSQSGDCLWLPTLQCSVVS